MGVKRSTEGKENEMIEQHKLFSTPLWHVKAERSDEAMIFKAYSWCLELQKTVKPQKRSSRGGWQSPSVSFNEMEPEFFTFLQEKLSFLPEFQFLNWWININNKEDYNICHTHPDATLSVIWYLTHNHNSLVFLSPFSHTRQGLSNMFNDKTILLDECNCNPCDILVFPSDLPHYVEPHALNSKRVSIALNLLERQTTNCHRKVT